MSDPRVDELRRVLGTVHQAVHDETERAVAAQRLAGTSWAAIGELLGIPKSTAHERWSYVDRWPKGVAISRSGVFRDVATGAVVGRPQLDQVAKHGRIIDHHPQNALPA